MSSGRTSADRVVATLLGSPSLRWRAEEVGVTSRKGRALLYHLAMVARPVPRSTLASLLWGDERLGNVRQELAHLRRLAGADEWLTAGDPVQLIASSDVAAFEDAVAREQFSRALQLWRGELLEGFGVAGAPGFSEWVEAERERLDVLRIKAMKGRAASLEREGDTVEALDLLHRLLAIDPLDESTHRSVMRLEYARGNVQAALEQFEACRRSLREELGLAPFAATSDLANAIQRGSGGGFPMARPVSIPPRLLRPGVLVGREREWALLERAWSERTAIFITGPPGVGKTRLLLDFARSRGRYLLNEGHATDAAFPLSTLGRGIRRVRAALPHLDLEPPVRRALARVAPDAFPDEPSGDAGDRARVHLVQAWFVLLDAVRREVDALPADDVHWFDPASAFVAEAVSARFAREEAPSFRHVAAFRPDEMPRPVLRRVLGGAEAGISTVIELRPLQVDAVSDLLTHLEVPADEDFVSQLYDYTGGNPLFVVEVLRDLYARGRLEPSVARFELPARITGLMQRRLDALDPAGLRLLRAVAITHPDGSPELLATMLDLHPLEVAEGVGTLEREQWLGDGRFTHDLQFEAVVAHMPSTVSRYLHRRAADAHATGGGDSARIAYHLEAGGASERAVPLWLDASREHRANGIYEEAVALLGKVVEHAEGLPAAQEARVEIARTRVAQGEPEAALRELELALRSPLSATLRSEAAAVQAAARELVTGTGRSRRGDPPHLP